MNRAKNLHSELIKRCKKNNENAQMQLYDMYCKAMYNTACNFVKREDIAQDIMQDSFIKAFKKINSFNEEASFGSWLKRIVINNCLDYLKKKQLQEVTLEEYHAPVQEDSNWEVENVSSIHIVYECIELLPVNYRNVIKLYLLEGYDHSEVSQILEISEVTSRSHLHRGKNKLKQLLESRNYEN